MTTLRTRLKRSLLFVVLAALPVAAAAEGEARRERITALLGGVGWNKDLGGGLRFDHYREFGGFILFELARLKEGQRAVVGTLRLSGPTNSRRRTRNFSLDLQLQKGYFSFNDPELRKLEEAAMAALHKGYLSVHARDNESYKDLIRIATEQRRWIPAFRTLRIILAVILLWIGALFWLRKDLKLETRLKAAHLVPALIQTTLYAYWFFYYPEVGKRYPCILLQVLFAYLFDAALSLTLRRRWALTFGPMPIVFSTNLFVWYERPWLQFGVIALALLSKAFLQRKGRHIFNPAAFGISVPAALALLAPRIFPWGVPTTGPFLNIPPNTSEIMLLLAVAAQIRFPIALISFSVIAALNLLSIFSPPPAMWPATLLILLLFTTDPATTPRNNGGRVLYGAALGIMITILSIVIRNAGQPEDYSKVFPLMFASCFLPQFDRAGKWLEKTWECWPHKGPWTWRGSAALLLTAAFLSALPAALWGLVAFLGAAALVDARRRRRGKDVLSRAAELFRTLLDPKWNLIHVAALLFLAVSTHSPRMKTELFQTFTHWGNDTRGMVFDADGIPRCSSNPAWCTPFSFKEELKALR